MQVDVTLDGSAADLIAQFGEDAKLYLYRAAAEEGPYSEVVAAATVLVAGTDRYELQDPAGAPGISWYKPRVGDAGGTLFAGDPSVTDPSDGEYIAPFLSTSLTAYATLDQLKRTIKTVADTNDAVLEGYLGDASAFIDGKLHRRFYRDPQVSGTTTRTFRVTRSSASLCRAVRRGIDIISVTTITVADGTGATPTELAAADWYLLDPDYEGHPSPDLVLSDVGTRSTWPIGFDTVSITGVFGFPAVPDAIRRATLEIAREMHRQGAGGAGAAQGVNQYGVPVFMTGYPPTVREVLAIDSIYRHQSFAWV